jgi:hypothetical protein
MLLLLGIAVGAHGLGLLSPAVLSFLDPAMPVALVAIGVLIGLRARTWRTNRRLLAAAHAPPLLAAAVVFAGIVFIAPGWGASAELPYWFLALVLAVAAASSFPDAVLPIVAGGLALAVLRERFPADAFLLTLQAVAIALVIAAAGWLLLTKSRSDTEQRVFAIALLLLLGGASDYLGLSALFSGLVAGMFLEYAGGPARDYVRRDVLHVQHPLLVLVVVVTGAQVEIDYPWLGLGAAYLALATAGQYAGVWLGGRMAAGDARAGGVLPLLAPGLLGIAFALNVLRAAGPDAAPALAVVAFGAIGADLLRPLVRPVEALA